MRKMSAHHHRSGLLLLVVYWLLCWPSRLRASEFPERECCDPIYPVPEPTSKIPKLPSPTGKSESDKTVAILNCMYARQLCFEHPSCAAILEIIPRVCGPEIVACSTVTVTKCQVALRSLQAFEFFKPTCLCREPHVDPECNSFRDFLFDHPCIYAAKKEKDPNAIETLPLCTHALSNCQRDGCIEQYDNYKKNCKTRDGRCRMENRDACHEAWTQLRLSPMFGCICPENSGKKRCDKIFSMVNHNPCVVNVISNSDNTTTLELIESQLENPLIDPDHQDLHALKQLPIPNIQLPHHHRFHHKQRNQSHDDHEGNLVAPSSLPDNERIAQQPVKVILTSTCHHAYSTCNNDAECRALVQPVLSHCDHSKCKRNECMKALQQFYKMANSKHSMDIGFCLCKKSEGSKRDDCSKAKELMHPSCALRVPQGAETPSCDALADNCRKDPSCRSKLELYEQSCSVDSVTKKCAGPPLGCRKAMLGILGTELRSNCACRSTDLKLYYECLGWQRLLWVNPCVVEAQKDFHAWRNKHHGHPKPPPSNELRPTTPAPSPTQESYSPEPTQPTPIRRPSSWPSVVTPKASLVAATSFGLAEQEEIVEEQEVAQEIEEEDNVIPEIMTVGKLEPITDPPTSATEPETERITTEKMTTTTTTTTTSTTPAPTTPSTPPPRFCVVQRAHQSHQYIRVGKGKRLYSQSEPDCSELCQCGEGEVLTCNTICVESLPCKTDFAFYNHAAPAYQAFRGRCLCYSGRFICMRPSPETYNIPHGVFMFLGYSETDENLLKPHNNLTVVDAVSSLDNFMREEVNNKTVCTLFLYNLTKENVIAVARLVTDNTLSTNLTQAQTLKHLVRIKEECASMMQNLSEKINNRHQEVHTHPLLSIFKMAEVEIKLPKASSASRLSSRPCGTSIIVVAISIIFSVSTFSS